LLYQFIQSQQPKINFMILAIFDFLQLADWRESRQIMVQTLRNSHKQTEYNWILQSGKWQDIHCIFFTYWTTLIMESQISYVKSVKSLWTSTISYPKDL